MSRSRLKPIVIGAVVLTLIAVLSFLFRSCSSESHEGQVVYDTLVLPIVNSAQTYDGEYVDKLVGQGAEVIPGLSYGLNVAKENEFPIVFVQALEQFASPSSNKASIEWALSHVSYDDGDNLSAVGYAFYSSGVVDDREIIDDVVEIVQSESAPVPIRLAAANFLARQGESLLQQIGSNYILETVANVPALLARRTPYLSTQDVFDSLLVASGDRARDTMLQVSKGFVTSEYAKKLLTTFEERFADDKNELIVNLVSGENELDPDFGILLVEKYVSNFEKEDVASREKQLIAIIQQAESSASDELRRRAAELRMSVTGIAKDFDE